MLIGISGISGSGKTTFAEKLMAKLESEIGIINTDSYYKSFSELSKSERDKLNFDEPSMLDLELFHSHLIKIKQANTIDIPIYNFKSHIREKK